MLAGLVASFIVLTFLNFTKKKSLLENELTFSVPFYFMQV